MNHITITFYHMLFLPKQKLLADFCSERGKKWVGGSGNAVGKIKSKEESEFSLLISTVNQAMNRSHRRFVIMIR